jgi:hypothetical protein
MKLRRYLAAAALVVGTLALASAPVAGAVASVVPPGNSAPAAVATCIPVMYHSCPI